MKVLSLFIAAFPCAIATDCHDNNLPLSPTATLDSGPIFGVQTTLPGALGAVNKFLGVPFAAPPERFSLPQKPQPWRSPKNATEFGPSCTQYIPHSNIEIDYDVLNDLFNFAHPPESEDCLLINVFAPANPSPPGGRPIVLFIPGGAYSLGNGLFDLSGFAGYEDIIAITFNYRTNILGFPNSPDIPFSARNLGLYDQRLALKWVQSNAHAFGGNPSKITLWGESAGAMSVDLHLHTFAKTDPPPFRAAIMFSGQFSFGMLGFTGNGSDYAYWTAISKKVGCADPKTQLSCMKKVPAEALIQALDGVQTLFTPLADGVTVPPGRAKAWRRGDVLKVPILTGTIKDEGRALVNSKISLELFERVYLSPPVVTQQQRDAIVAYYKNLPNLKTDFDIATAIYTDFLWACPQGRLANISASLPNPTWRYNFNISITPLLPPKFQYLEKFHGSDIILLTLSPTYEANAIPKLTPELYTFANYFRGLVGRFVRNPHGGAGWSATGSKDAPYDVAVLGDVGETHTSGATPVDHRVLDERCVLFDDVYKVIEAFS